jgi:hypothetical protein
MDLKTATISGKKYYEVIQEKRSLAQAEPAAPT